MVKKKLRRAPMYIALAGALPIAIGACSNSGSQSSAAASSGSTAGTEQSGMAQFALCMRQNGVTNFPDPADGKFVMGGNIQSNPHFSTAIQACEHLLGPGGISSGASGSQQSAELNFVHCMQTSGVPSFPDPENGAIVAPPGVDRSSATYQHAFNKCKSKLPNGGAGLGG